MSTKYLFLFYNEMPNCCFYTTMSQRTNTSLSYLFSSVCVFGEELSRVESELPFIDRMFILLNFFGDMKAPKNVLRLYYTKFEDVQKNGEISENI